MPTLRYPHHTAQGRFTTARDTEPLLVNLSDGSAHRLHAVALRGLPDKFLCALETSAGTLRVFDLRHIARPLGEDLSIAYECDRAGIVAYTLRSLYRTGPALHLAIQRAELGYAQRANTVDLEAA